MNVIYFPVKRLLRFSLDDVCVWETEVRALAKMGITVTSSLGEIDTFIFREVNISSRDVSLRIRYELKDNIRTLARIVDNRTTAFHNEPGVKIFDNNWALDMEVKMFAEEVFKRIDKFTLFKFKCFSFLRTLFDF